MNGRGVVIMGCGHDDEGVVTVRVWSYCLFSNMTTVHTVLSQLLLSYSVTT